ncbi:GapA-binding peptide SR1P [Bacillus salipaludis]|nr:GapA-binding peptide SR1P [Bacillus salipaludis]
MLTIVCKHCNTIIEYHEEEKVSTLYSQCKQCVEDDNE